jgi:hypothetical protein
VLLTAISLDALERGCFHLFFCQLLLLLLLLLLHFVDCRQAG